MEGGILGEGGDEGGQGLHAEQVRIQNVGVGGGSRGICWRDRPLEMEEMVDRKFSIPKRDAGRPVFLSQFWEGGGTT